MKAIRTELSELVPALCLLASYKFGENDPEKLKKKFCERRLNMNLYMHVEMLKHTSTDQGIACGATALLKNIW